MGCHGFVRFYGFWAVSVSSAIMGFGLSRSRPLLGVLRLSQSRPPHFGPLAEKTSDRSQHGKAAG